MDTIVTDPLVGRLVDRRYDVVSRVARGGMAAVYEAVDVRLDRTVALKVMHAALAQDDAFVARFIREAKSAARLSHPNVVTVYDQGTDGDIVFLAMEYVPGRTLRQALHDHRRLTVAQAFDVLDQVLAALGAAHDAGIVHRDVKPENVLLTDDGRVKVADFGLARAVGAANATATTGVLIGTVSYLAPEQVSRGIAGPPADVYSAGILLFEMLTGRKPHTGDSPFEIAYRHVHEDVPPPSSLVTGLPPAADALVARATAREADHRPADANRFRVELASTRQSLPAGALAARGTPRPGADDTADRTIVVPNAPPRPGRAGPSTATGPLGQGARPQHTAPVELTDGGRPTGPDPRRRRRRGAGALVLLLLLVGLLSGGAWYMGAGPGAYTTAPSLLGLAHDAAVAKARKAGLSVRWADGRYDESAAKGTVLSETPGPNGKVRKHGTITVVPSLGKERHPVPTLAGDTLAAATAALTAAHLTLGGQSRAYSETVPSGQVLSSDPAPGVALKPDTAVSVVLSRGPLPVKVPTVTGRSLDDATATLTGLHLQVTSTKAFSDTVPDGVVISQAPASGVLPKGGTVALVVSSGPPPVPIPDVVGQRVDKARKTLEKAGFHVSVDNVLGGFFGIVRSETPPASGGATAPRGSTITITVV